jgi:hypothetical protein
VLPLLLSAPPPPAPAAGTTITGAIPCLRKAWLQERFSSPGNDRAVLGTLMHSLLASGLHLALQGGLSHQELAAQVGLPPWHVHARGAATQQQPAPSPDLPCGAPVPPRPPAAQAGLRQAARGLGPASPDAVPCQPAQPALPARPTCR